ncbi:MAG: flagellar protein FlaG [Bryobacterales bacterium]
MTIAETQGLRDVAPQKTGDGPSSENAARNREIQKAIQAINEGGGAGSNSELRFAIDDQTGQALIRIVDRTTDEVITQFPPEATLRTAEILKRLQPGDRIA